MTVDEISDPDPLTYLEGAEWKEEDQRSTWELAPWVLAELIQGVYETGESEKIPCMYGKAPRPMIRAISTSVFRVARESARSRCTRNVDWQGSNDLLLFSHVNPQKDTAILVPDR